MKATPLVLMGLILVVTGCASLDQLHATRNAVNAGLIDGLDNSSRFSAIIWSWPAKPWGPYSDIGGFTATVTNGTYSGHYMTFFLGKSRATKQWEVFSTFTWENGKWKPLQVTLPEPKMEKKDSNQKVDTVSVSAKLESADFGRHPGPDKKKLAGIKLPENADRAQLKQYIREIITASKGQRMWGHRDPQVAMYMKVGSDNVDLLIEALSIYDGTCNFHIKFAIVNLADEKNKALVLEGLPVYHDLVRAVIRQGWGKDAKDILLNELKNSGIHLPTVWITAVANLHDPDSYPLLRNYFINGTYKYITYREIKHLPIEDMPGAVSEAWKRSKEDVTSREGMATVAFKYGHIDALPILLDILINAEEHGYCVSSEIRPAISKHIDFQGSTKELAQWYEKNRDNLRFDPKTEKFVIDK